ncbi:MAG: hypothetical protein N2444_02655 [Methylocystis sp.]|nr:hypothetical protein [Methylocystis sp.]
MKIRSPLSREIALALAFKFVALIALYALFFSPAHRIRPTAGEMVGHFSRCVENSRQC